VLGLFPANVDLLCREVVALKTALRHRSLQYAAAVTGRVTQFNTVFDLLIELPESNYLYGLNHSSVANEHNSE
jgi:hypothetical protein